MEREYILVEYCRGITELTEFLEEINPDDLMEVSERAGYTVVYKSRSRHSWEYER